MAAERRLVVASNRLPSLRPPASKEEARSEPRSKSEAGCGSAGAGIRRVAPLARRQRCTDLGRFQLAAVDLTRREAALFYNGFCNRTLWPLLHSFLAKVVIRHEAYGAYLRVNRRYAAALLPLLRPDDLLWVQDYHLFPMGSELRRLGWNGKMGAFLHTPFPPREVFSVLPWAKAMLSMLMDFDLFELHTRRYVSNVFDCLAAEVEGVAIGDTYVSGERVLRVKANPIRHGPGEHRSSGGPVRAQVDGRFPKRTAAHSKDRPWRGPAGLYEGNREPTADH